MYVSLRRLDPRILYGKIPKKKHRIVSTLGTVLFFLSLLLVPSVVIAFNKGEDMVPYLVPMVPGFILSSYMFLRYDSPRDLRPADGLVMMFLMWMMMFFFGTIPYLLSGFDFVNSFFESVSGFSTTGATIIPDVHAVPEALLMWRIITNWVGGIIIVLMFMFIVPMVVSGGRGLLTNEMSGSGGGNMFLKLGQAAKQFIVMYAIFTAAFSVVFFLLGLSPFDALTMGMSTISIGGFTNTNDSLLSYEVPVRIATIIFLFISASNFYLHYRAFFKGDFKGYKKSEEFKAMAGWYFLVFLILVGYVALSGRWSVFESGPVEAVTDMALSVVSFGTTAGYTTVDPTTHWALMGCTVVVLLMFVGGSSGSTAGGIKVTRAIIVFKAMANEVRLVVHPNSVYSVKYEHQGMNDASVHSAMVITIVFALVIVFGSLVLNSRLTLEEAIFASTALITNTGTGIGVLSSNYCSLGPGLKMFCCLLMFLGRMEVLTIIAMFTPGLWKEFFGPRDLAKIKANLTGQPIISRIKDKAEKDEIPLLEEFPPEQPPKMGGAP